MTMREPSITPSITVTAFHKLNTKTK